MYLFVFIFFFPLLLLCLHEGEEGKVNFRSDFSGTVVRRERCGEGAKRTKTRNKTEKQSSSAKERRLIDCGA
ncbi:MAG: hypothetical protein JOS17DRAFT_758795 [Linnemannia elongata]|nr:MAG: hypothetical protein JOS17DRAFT_758795 [Linnemannia elongata]